MTNSSYCSLTTNSRKSTLHLQGAWVVGNITELKQELALIDQKMSSTIHIQPDKITQLDTVGIWLLLDWLNTKEKKNIQVVLDEFPDEYHAMVERVKAAFVKKKVLLPQRAHPIKRMIEHVGEAGVGIVTQFVALISFFGLSIVTFSKTVLNPKKWQIAELARHIEETGVNALPIVAVTAILISVVLAYQGAFQLRQFGADIYTVDLVSVAILREMGVLLTAILVAGRSGSAFAAELGVMQVTQEIDALRTLGISPFNVLVLPRMIALMITLPLLAFFADMMGLLGGAAMIYILMDITLMQFVSRLQEAIVFSTYWVGIVKAPFFAMIIALVGCLRGMQATGSAEKVGALTTKAVVESIFLVIVADALFSVLFTKWNV